MNPTLFYNVLRKLEPSGEDGFEGLITKLLGFLTNRTFFLAKAGYQAGRDSSTGGIGSNVIAVECKRYKEDTELNDRQILGELEEVTQSLPYLDLWVLVASRKVDDSLRAKLSESARKKSIEVITIETEDSTLGSLAVLCAASLEIVVDHIRQNLPAEKAQDITAFLNTVKKHPDYSMLLLRLRESLSPAYIGYDNYRKQQNEWFKTRLNLEKSSRAAFGQILNVLDSKIKLVRRKRLEAELNQWLDTWNSSHEIFSLLGEEGDGKTWAAATWLTSKIDADFPPIIFFASKHVTSTEPLDLVARAIAVQTNNDDPVFWKRKVSSWLERPTVSKPYFLLILDGMNERPSFHWRALLEGLDVEPWRGRVAVMLTCRTTTWTKRFLNLKHLEFQTYTLQPFDDVELNEALHAHALKISDIKNSLLTIIRKPRYFDLALRFRGEMAASGDVTTERLIYEDWRDRFRRKNISETFSHEDFLILLKTLASDASSEAVTFSEREIDEALSPLVTDRGSVIEELISSGLFVADREVGGKYKVERRRLIHGFGLLLAEQVSLASHKGEEAVEEAIAALLEPHSDMDIKVAICGAAVFHSLLKANFPQMGCIAMFKAWLENRNLDEESQEGIEAYFPIRPELYFQLAEYFWSDSSDNHMVQDHFMASFLRWRELPVIKNIFVSAFERWMGIVNPYGFPFMHRLEGEKDSACKRIAERSGGDLPAGPLEFDGYRLFVSEDDGLLRLARVALAVISHSQRRLFVRAFILWSISRSIMGYFNEHELVEWVLRSAPDEIWKDLKIEATRLSMKTKNVFKEGAYRLLSSEGSAEAYKLRASLPSELVPKNPLYEMYAKEPCAQRLYLWSKDTYRDCLARVDVPPSTMAINMKELALEPELPVPENLTERLSRISSQISPNIIWANMGTTAEDHFLEQIETAMSAFAPHAFASIIKSVIRDISNRNGLPLRQLSLQIKENLLILGRDELKAVNDMWSKLCLQDSLTGDDAIVEEMLFTYVIADYPPKRQVNVLLSRPEGARNLIFYESLFKPLPDGEWDFIESKLSSTSDITGLQRLLWFISANPERLPSRIVEIILSLQERDDTLVRSLVFEILLKSGQQPQIGHFIRGQWQWSLSNCNEENYWGSRLLCEFGTELSYSEIRSRVHPSYLGYAIMKRGLITEDVKQYAQDINLIWKKISGNDIPRSDYVLEIDIFADRLAGIDDRGSIYLSPGAYSKSFHFVSRDAFWGGARSFSDITPEEIASPISDEKIKRFSDQANRAIKEQLEAGNLWFSSRFYTYSLREVVDLCPDLVNSWLDAVAPETSDAARLIFLAESFYLSLCEVLCKIAPDQGLRLFRRLKTVLERGIAKVRVIDSYTHIGLLEYALFGSREVPEVLAEWDYCLESCSSDMELLELAVVSQETNRLAWLKDKIVDGLDSRRLIRQARSMVLAGFLEGGDGGETLTNYIEYVPNSWVKQVAETSLKWWRKNEWSKYWFIRFLESDNEVLAWSSFKLFLKCVDRRFWLWNRVTVDAIGKNGWRHRDRLTYLTLNLQSVKTHIEMNEKNLKDMFLSHKILRNETWPWMSLYQ